MRAAALVVLCLLAPVGTPAWAANPWLCSLSQDLTRLVCLTEPDPLDEPLPGVGAAPTAVVNGTRFPLDPRHTYTVDFWAPITELDRAELLAQSTICYRSPGCEVIFTAAALWRSAAVPLRGPSPRMGQVPAASR